MKTNRNIFVCIFWSLFIFVITFDVLAQRNLPKIREGKVYQQSGVTITSPNQPDWQLVKAGKLETIFAKTKTDGKFKALAKTMTVEVFENVKDLLENLEKQKQDEISQ